jgi:hypothetical protein
MKASICICILGAFWSGWMGYLFGKSSQPDPVRVAMLPAVRVDITPSVERELDRCRALVQEQGRISDEDHKICDDACNQRVEALVREAYPKDANLIIRSGPHFFGEVEWFVGRGAPKDLCDPGSLYSRTDTGVLYVCEAGKWRMK